MRLNEFTNPRNYTLSTDDMAAAILKQIKRVWCDYGIDADAPMLLRITNEPEGRKGESIDASRR
jgi:hypothetical protein